MENNEELGYNARHKCALVTVAWYDLSYSSNLQEDHFILTGMQSYNDVMKEIHHLYKDDIQDFQPIRVEVIFDTFDQPLYISEDLYKKIKNDFSGTSLVELSESQD